MGGEREEGRRGMERRRGRARGIMRAAVARRQPRGQRYKWKFGAAWVDGAARRRQRWSWGNQACLWGLWLWLRGSPRAEEDSASCSTTAPSLRLVATALALLPSPPILGLPIQLRSQAVFTLPAQLRAESTGPAPATPRLGAELGEPSEDLGLGPGSAAV